MVSLVSRHEMNAMRSPITFEQFNSVLPNKITLVYGEFIVNIEFARDTAH